MWREKISKIIRDRDWLASAKSGVQWVRLERIYFCSNCQTLSGSGMRKWLARFKLAFNREFAQEDPGDSLGKRYLGL